MLNSPRSTDEYSRVHHERKGWNLIIETIIMDYGTFHITVHPHPPIASETVPFTSGSLHHMRIPPFTSESALFTSESPLYQSTPYNGVLSPPFTNSPTLNTSLRLWENGRGQEAKQVWAEPGLWSSCECLPWISSILFFGVGRLSNSINTMNDAVYTSQLSPLYHGNRLWQCYPGPHECHWCWGCTNKILGDAA